MEIAEFIETLRRDGELLADAAAEAGPDAPVPPCPEWRVGDLVRHQGFVHRWAAGFVLDGRTDPVGLPEDGPDDDTLLAWYREGHVRLADGLAASAPDVQCWHFLPAPSPLAFWARRQAHETAIHRVDAEAALGKGPSPIAADFAADGVDELLAGLLVRPTSRVRSDRPRTLRVRTADMPGDWLVRISQDPPLVERAGAGEADCTLEGPAADLYLALWNRGSYEGLEVSGDASLVELWRRTSAIG